VKTVISVDGIRPDVERARQFGLRYVHIPVGYGGITREQAIHLVRAAGELPGPIYVHCHHGQHRGPAAAAIVRRCRPDGWTADEAVAFLHTAGTDPKYEGLYASVRDLTPPSAAELHRVPSDFPEVADIPDLTARMVEIDDLWDGLKRARANGWQPSTPAESVAHLALRLNEQFREVARLTGTAPPTEEFTLIRGDAEAASGDLESALRAGAATAAAADKAYIRTATACAACHRDYRDRKRP
jgi:cytochrome c553